MKRLITEMRHGLSDDGPIVAGLVLVWGMLLVLLASQGVSGLRIASYASNLMLYLVMLAVVLLFVMIANLRRDRPISPIRYLLSWARGDGAGAALRGIPMLFALVVFMPVFSAMKSAIPVFGAYTWDPVWVAADQAVFGMDAWQFMQPVLGFPFVTSLLSVAYHAWLFLLYAGGMYFCFVVRDRELRAQYFIGFFATWTVLGVVMATGFASVGPCFLAPLFGDHRFDQQMAYLEAADAHYRVMVLPVQEMLLEGHRQGKNGLASGISAMPSMHVSMALLSALAIGRVSRRAGFVAYAFLAVIFLGSVHLAYHYAADGFVSIGATAAIWILARPLAKRVVKRRPMSSATGRLDPAPSALTT